MKKQLDVKVFEQVKKYVVAKGKNYNSDRCINVDVAGSNATVCFNDEVQAVAICEVNGEENDFAADMVLSKLIELSQGCIYTEKEEKDYNKYIERVECQSECCEYNCTKCWRNM
jgi:hypothetical protein